jgi:hypothetical protein
MTDSLEILNLSSINLEEEGAKKLGITLSKVNFDILRTSNKIFICRGLNASLKKVDLSWNHIRSQGAAMLAKGLSVIL